MDPKGHWEGVYGAKSHKEVSWYAEHVSVSLALIARTGVSRNAALVDIGGGASTLVDDLLSAGYSDLTVLDLSGAALEIARVRLESLASSVRWLEEDALASDFGGRVFDLWHDRAVFHFLTAESDRERYRDRAERHVRPGGFLVFSVFADDGPEKCSGLPVRRHSEKDLAGFFAAGFRPVHAERTVHTTPGGQDQRFVNVILQRRAGPA